VHENIHPADACAVARRASHTPASGGWGLPGCGDGQADGVRLPLLLAGTTRTTVTTGATDFVGRSPTMSS
jgi:hypothetical protein